MKGHRIIIVGAIASAASVMALGRDTVHGATTAPRAAHQAVDGKAVYLKSCKECHGVIGAPTKASLRKYDKIPNFTDPEFFKNKKHSELEEAVEKGKGRDMKGFADKLSKDEIKAVAEYIQTLEKKT